MIRTIELLPHFSITIAIGYPLSRPFGRGRKAIARNKPVEGSLPAPLVAPLAISPESDLASAEPLPKVEAAWRVVDGRVSFAWTILPQTGGEVSPE